MWALSFFTAWTIPDMWTKDNLPDVEPDGLYVPEVGEWGCDKYLRVWMYDEIFARSMKGKWTRVYLDLFAGAGYAYLKGSKRIVPSSALLALQIPDPFDLYIFCEADPKPLAALQARVQRLNPSVPVHFVKGDANESVEAILRLIPVQRSLTFCFVDPFGTNVRLSAIRQLANARKMDFLILLALGMDANRNRDRYQKEACERLDDFLGGRDWRKRWEEAKRSGKGFRGFLAEQYAEAMSALGYLDTNLEEMYPYAYHIETCYCTIWRSSVSTTSPKVFGLKCESTAMSRPGLASKVLPIPQPSLPASHPTYAHLIRARQPSAYGLPTV
ncbi:MAG TPA: three-Cys-motif partner protein TcmP [Longimicrobiaceae bacterium]|nr:three-Cys-motif partner protein TcmP [Longimicrobiaceae bacterium]